MKYEPLNEHAIRHCLDINREDMQFHIFDEIHSTSCYLKEQPPKKNIQVCAAESQTRGRGRFGRRWDSSHGENIYLSIRLPLDCSLQKLSGISLLAGLAVLASFDDYEWADDLKIKWPNDILWQHKKLCGILVETANGLNGKSDLIIGIGLNVNQRFPEPERCSLIDIAEIHFDRNQEIAKIICSLQAHLKLFQQHGMDFSLRHWKKADYLLGQYVKVSTLAGIVEGEAAGVNTDGQLCLKREDGEVVCLSSGEASLKEFVPGFSN